MASRRKTEPSTERCVRFPRKYNFDVSVYTAVKFDAKNTVCYGVSNTYRKYFSLSLHSFRVVYGFDVAVSVLSIVRVPRYVCTEV